MNKVILIGNLTKDPDLNTTTNGNSCCKFNLAVNRNFTNSEGEREADFIPIVCWRRLADNVAKYVKKGSKVGVFGSIRTRNYEADDGTRRYVTEINADEIQFLSTSGEKSKEQDQRNAQKISDLEPIEDGELPF